SGDLDASSGSVFVLEMGEAVRILDLARNMITLAGYEPDVDVAIEFVGPRSGEKIHEELYNVDEHAQPTSADRIVRAVRTRRLDAGARAASKGGGCLGAGQRSRHPEAERGGSPAAHRRAIPPGDRRRGVGRGRGGHERLRPRRR